MENLNAEQIKKALECCASSQNLCEECPIDQKKKDDCVCGQFLAQNALALINSQEQKIKELTEEKTELWKERNRIYDDLQDWKEIAEGYQKQFEDCYEKKAKLTEENERLEQHRKILEAKNERLEIICNSYALQYGTVADKEVFLKKERADTVRKMHKEIIERCIKGGIYPAFVATTIDKIAKEMLE